MNHWTFGRQNPIAVHALELRSVGHVSYVLVDTLSRTAAVIDPPRDVDPLLELANHYGARVRHVFLTKFHSDFETGHLDLIARAGATVYTGAWGNPEYNHLPLKDGDVLQFGNTSLKVCETPGHVLEGLSLVASEMAGAGRPWGLFPGDLIFEGDIARPEPRLDDGFTVPDMAAMLYDSLHRKLLKLPPEILIFSGHRPWSTSGGPPCLATLRNRHPLLRPQSCRTFVQALSRGRLAAPLSRATRTTLNRSTNFCRAIGLSSRLPELSATDLLAAVGRRAVPLDLREPMEFAAGHVRGSLSLGLGAHFEPWAASILDATDEHVLICNPGSEEEAAVRLRPLIGSRISGLLTGGMTAFEGRTDFLCGEPAAGGGCTRLDVGDVPSSRCTLAIPLEELLGRLPDLPAPPAPIDVLDPDPQRACSAASLLNRKGWALARPVVPPRAPTPRRAVPR
jgi:glyoxylase-like metal-dependent hydrolase (beta-lactamase superfamily II)/rhodanese-related sulfurtransferase